MGKSIRLKPKKSFRENAVLLIPTLVSEFFSFRKIVLKDASHVNELHQMRLAGKTLRYAMETFEPAFGKKFSACLTEVKNALEIMGLIHDCDVCIMTLTLYIEEQQKASLASNEPAQPLTAIENFLNEQRKERKKLYLKFRRILIKWKNEAFKKTIVGSLK